jgi:D-alanine-D-alanine ligase
MHVGLTYDLRDEYLAAGYGEEETAEFDRADTIDALAGALRELGHDPDRIGNARQLVQRLACGDRWDLVVNIAEGLRGVAREAQVPAILEVYEVPYTFSDPLVMALCLHKGFAKTAVKAAGVPTPDFAVVEELADVEELNLPFPLFAKPLAEGTGKGIGPSSVLRNRSALKRLCAELLARYRQPVLVETYLPGRELTVGLVGTGANARVLGTLEIVLLAGAEPEAYSYKNKELCEDLVDYRLVRPEEDEEVRGAESLALKAWRALGCRDAGRIDFRSDSAGRPHFLEANPLAGLHPAHSDLPMLCTRLEIGYSDLIDRIIRSAAERLEPDSGKRLAESAARVQ